MKYVVFIILIILSKSAVSWSDTVTSKINKVEVTAEANYAFRVHLAGSPTMCGNNHTWAYLNKADSNYETYVSALLAAKFAKSEVTVYSNAQSDGTCKIGRIDIE